MGGWSFGLPALIAAAPARRCQSCPPRSTNCDIAPPTCLSVPEHLVLLNTLCEYWTPLLQLAIGPMLPTILTPDSAEGWIATSPPKLLLRKTKLSTLESQLATLIAYGAFWPLDCLVTSNTLFSSSTSRGSGPFRRVKKMSKYAQLRKIELRTVKPCTPPAQMHSMCTELFVATASWKSTPSSRTFVDAGCPEICIVGWSWLPP